MRIGGEVDIRPYEEMIAQSLKEISDPAKRMDAVRSYALLFIQKVVPITPVDTGRARAAWTVGLKRLGGSRVQIGGTATGRATGQTEGKFRERIRKSDMLAEIFNGVPYINLLELGYSPQAPSGFVRIALRDMAKEMTEGERRRVEAAFRVGNRKARRRYGMTQGRRPMRNVAGRFNLLRR